MPLQVVDIFLECYEAIRRGELIKRQSARDKEFHFQDWFEARLEALGLNYEAAGRNKYPDFSLVHSPEGSPLMTRIARYPQANTMEEKFSMSLAVTRPTRLERMSTRFTIC